MKTQDKVGIAGIIAVIGLAWAYTLWDSYDQAKDEAAVQAYRAEEAVAMAYLQGAHQAVCSLDNDSPGESIPMFAADIEGAVLYGNNPCRDNITMFANVDNGVVSYRFVDDERMIILEGAVRSNLLRSCTGYVARDDASQGTELCTGSIESARFASHSIGTPLFTGDTVNYGANYAPNYATSNQH